MFYILCHQQGDTFRLMQLLAILLKSIQVDTHTHTILGKN